MPSPVVASQLYVHVGIQQLHYPAFTFDEKLNNSVICKYLIIIKTSPKLQHLVVAMN